VEGTRNNKPAVGYECSMHLKCIQSKLAQS